jgi:hypothetical protein
MFRFAGEFIRELDNKIRTDLQRAFDASSLPPGCERLTTAIALAEVRKLQGKKRLRLGRK